MTIETEIRRIATTEVGSEIPKPAARAAFLVKGLGMRRGEPALIYTIPSHTGRRPHQKGITFSEFALALAELNKSGEFTRAWFEQNLAACAKEGGCNFTSLGGVFQILGLAFYGKRGRYVSRTRDTL